MALAGVMVDVPRGGSVGGYGFGVLCRPPYNDIAWNQRPAWDRQLAVAVRDGMAVGGAPLADDTRRGPVGPVQPWHLSARVTDIRFDLCRAVDLWFGKSTGETGSATVQVEWTLQRAGYGPIKLVNQGKGGSDAPAVGDTKLLILTNAVADAAQNLARLPEFRTALAITEVAAAPSPASPSDTMAAEPDEGEEGDNLPVGDATLVVSGWQRQRPALIVGAAGWVLMPLETEPGWPPQDRPTLVAQTGDGRAAPAIPVVWDRQSSAALLFMARGREGLPGVIPPRRRSPPVGSLLYAPGKPDRALMVAARREGSGLPVLLVDLPAGATAPPFLVDSKGRLAAMVAGPALEGDLRPYHPALPLLTRLMSQVPPDQLEDSSTSQSEKADRAGLAGRDFSQVSQ